MFLHVLADERHGHAPAVFHVVQETAFFRLEIRDEGDIGRGADQLDAFQVFLAIVDVDPAGRFDSEFTSEGGVLA